MGEWRTRARDGGEENESEGWGSGECLVGGVTSRQFGEWMTHYSARDPVHVSRMYY